MAKKIITRFPPSPTGFVHVGSLRTALYNYLFAKKNNGKFYLRIEDTDQERKVEGAVKNLIKILEIFKIHWDNKKPMVQSERIDIYKKFAKQLVKDGHAYYCFCTKERLDNLRQVQKQRGLPPMYDGKCENLSEDEIKKNIDEGQSYVIRFKMPKTGNTEFTDLIRNKVSFDNKTLDDPIILKSDGFPTYHLASIIDDHEMEISHVIRGEEWLPSTPKHIAIYKAFGWEIPEFAHLPLLLNPDRSKLSKRQGDVAVEDYLNKGYLPESLLNFVLLLGWNPGTDQEIFSLEEMIKIFDIAKVHKGGAIFNTEKLDWMNSEYIKKLEPKKFQELAMPFLQKNIKDQIDSEKLDKILEIERERINKLSEVGKNIKFLFTDSLSYDSEILVWKKSDATQTKNNLKTLIDFLDSLEDKDWTAETLSEKIINFIKEKNLTNGEILWPMRVALTGEQKSPPPFDIAEILGKQKSLNRLNQAVSLLK